MTDKLRGPQTVSDLLNYLARLPLDAELYLCGDIYGGATLYVEEGSTWREIYSD